MGISPNNWLITSHQKRESRPTWGSIIIPNRRERKTIYQKTCNPRLIFPRTFRTICKKPSTGRHPTTLFLRILPPQYTPHYFSHAHQIDFKTHPDRKTYLNAAYRYFHSNAQIAATCITIVGKLAFLCLSLTFGTTPVPSKYTAISEASIDLDNDLLEDASLGATNLQSPHWHLLPREYYQPASEPLVKADQLVEYI